jgi:hypothetical protein
LILFGPGRDRRGRAGRRLVRRPGPFVQCLEDAGIDNGADGDGPDEVPPGPSDTVAASTTAPVSPTTTG